MNENTTNEVKREFEAYVEDFRAQLGADQVTGGVGEDDMKEIDNLISDYRSQIEAAESEKEAQRRFDAFKQATERFGQGAGMP